MAPIGRAALFLLTALALVLCGSWMALSPATGSQEPASAGTLIKYHGTEAKAVLPLRDSQLPGAPAEFRTFVKTLLNAMWDDLGHTQACKTSPLITVEAVRTDGFALGAVNTRPRRHCPTGGGYVAVWAVRHGAWKEVIGTQDVVYCARLERFDIPSEIGVTECYQGGQIVPYDHP